MKKGNVYTIVFIFLISAVFTTVLASVNAYFLPEIKINAEIATKKSILKVLDIDISGSPADIEKRYNESVFVRELKDYSVYKRIDKDKNVLGYATFYKGPGLWGDISGYIAVNNDLTKIMGIEFLSHSETPGLGGRIDEPWFKDQFKGIDISKKQALSFKSGDKGEVDAITGATTTSRAVLDLVNTTIKSKLQRLEDLK